MCYFSSPLKKKMTFQIRYCPMNSQTACRQKQSLFIHLTVYQVKNSLKLKSQSLSRPQKSVNIFSIPIPAILNY